MALPTKSIAEFLLADRLPQRWEHNFGPHQWFRLPGFADRLKLLRVPYRGNGKDCSVFHRDCVKLMRSPDFRSKAAGSLPTAWQDEYPHLSWGTQISDKLLVRLVNAGDVAVTLDRAGHALVAVDALLRHYNLPAVPLVEHVRIAPAIYYVVGYQTFAKTVLVGASGRDAYDKLQKLMHNYEDAFYADLQDGHCVTYPTAQALLKAITQLWPEFKGEIKAISAAKREPRDDPSRKSADAVRPVRNEVLSF